MTLFAILRHLTFATTLALLSAAVVRAMMAVRVLDRPDARKAHTIATPKGGGVGVVVAFLVGIAVLYRFAEFARLADPYFIGVIEASVAIAVVAFLDDLYDWQFTVKLVAQVLAALVAVGSGIYVADYSVPYVGSLYIGWLGPVRRERRSSGLRRSSIATGRAYSARKPSSHSTTLPHATIAPQTASGAGSSGSPGSA